MAHNKSSLPRRYFGVMVSSTFTDLEKHRMALIKAIKGQGLTDVAMENDSAKPDVDMIDSSLQMVGDASAYIAIISHKYGQTPISPDRNPDKLSITELEFNEAQRLGRPILLFIMGDSHPVRKADVETESAKIEKLNIFRERAKQMKPDSQVHRVYATFDNLEEFSSKAIHAVAGLRFFLNEQNEPVTRAQIGTIFSTVSEPIPKSPAFYAEPPYIGSHKFLGRQAQLDALNDWAVAADPYPVLLFDAIGGSGKSMLTWEWTTKYASQIRGDWAGRFWYSFYERGAIMADFCRRALAYITSKPLDQFRNIKTLELSELLIHHLQAQPWLLVLDGLERVLVAYHRFDAAQVLDEVANSPTDQIAHRDPCAAIRPEDDDLLRALSAAAPSKMLITTRLIPRVLLNPASQPIPGVRRESLPGLLPTDAEALLRSCDVTGDSQSIQSYLKSHCDCHPLVTGILAGLINDYLPNKGNFDSWAADPAAGGQLNLANLDLVKKRNHILKAALDALPDKSHQLLSTLALLSEAVDYPTLSGFNPHLPPGPKEIEEPHNPEDTLLWQLSIEDNKKRMQREFEAARQLRKEYDQAVDSWRQSADFLAAPQILANTVRDLQHRGLLQYDRQSKRYDLHPVVRGIVAGILQKEETDRYGQRVVDHFSQQAHNPYSEAETLEDVRGGLHIIQTLLKMGRFDQAISVFRDELSNSLLDNLEAYAEVLSFLHPFFPNSWGYLPTSIDATTAERLAEDASRALNGLGLFEEALAVGATLLVSHVHQESWSSACNSLISISVNLGNLNRLAKDDYFRRLTLELATLLDSDYLIMEARIRRYRQLARIGQWEKADRIWQLINPGSPSMQRSSNHLERDAALFHALALFWQGDLQEEYLEYCEELAKSAKGRSVIRTLHSLRGEWYLEHSKWALAAESLYEAVRMARLVGISDIVSETELAIAKFHSGQLLDPQQDAERLSQDKDPYQRGLANLWLGIGDLEQAKKHSLLAYTEAWADGEPYVNRYELIKAKDLLEKLDVEIPSLPRYDPTKDEKLPYEDEVVAAIEKLRLKKNSSESPKTDE